MLLPKDSRRCEASVVAEPWDAVEAVERHLVNSARDPRAGFGAASGVGDDARMLGVPP